MIRMTKHSPTGPLRYPKPPTRPKLPPRKR